MTTYTEVYSVTTCLYSYIYHKLPIMFLPGKQSYDIQRCMKVTDSINLLVVI